MELYKLMTLVIMLNLALSMAATFSQPDKNWEDWATNNMAGKLSKTMVNIIEEGMDSENAKTLTDENTLENTGGMSLFKKAMAVFGIIENIIIGGLSVSLGMVLTTSAAGNSILNIIAWFSTLFIAMLYVWTGMKAYTWIKNRDSQ